jgi:sterol desaturase/sphingolipid hydroxylase (fatty acid hydroxylase superfamily)
VETSTELILRLGLAAALFVVFAAAEALWPRRHRVAARLRRWSTNLAITMLGIGVVRLLAIAAVPLVATAAARWAGEHDVGLLALLDLPVWAEWVIALAVLDAAIWLQHLLSHHIAILWRFHRVHHTDRDLDVTSGLRFHPVEIGLSMLYKVVVVLLLGPSVAAVVVFEVVLNGAAIFNHANLRLPAPLERVIRLLVVTPDVHRVHHSVDAREHQRNFGFSITLWDRLFGTFLGAPRAGHEGMTVGLSPFQSEAPTRLGWSLALPFARSAAAVREDEASES